jgi:hypothetical protein
MKRFGLAVVLVFLFLQAPVSHAGRPINELDQCLGGCLGEDVTDAIEACQKRCHEWYTAYDCTMSQREGRTVTIVKSSERISWIDADGNTGYGDPFESDICPKQSCYSSGTQFWGYLTYSSPIFCLNSKAPSSTELFIYEEGEYSLQENWSCVKE